MEELSHKSSMNVTFYKQRDFFAFEKLLCAKALHLRKKKKKKRFPFFCEDPIGIAFIPCLWLCGIFAADMIICCLVKLAAYNFAWYSKNQIGSLTDASHLLFPSMKGSLQNDLMCLSGRFSL